MGYHLPLRWKCLFPDREQLHGTLLGGRHSIRKGQDPCYFQVGRNQESRNSSLLVRGSYLTYGQKKVPRYDKIFVFEKKFQASEYQKWNSQRQTRGPRGSDVSLFFQGYIQKRKLRFQVLRKLKTVVLSHSQSKSPELRVFRLIWCQLSSPFCSM